MARLRRMTSTQMENVVAYRDDVLIATDTGNIFVSGASLADKVMIGKAAIGETADRPDAGVEGRFYYDNDIGALYIDNGESWVNASVEGAVSPDPHAASHIRGAADEIDGDKIDIDWNPANYTPAAVTNYSTSIDDLTSHLKGIDTAITAHTHATVAGLGITVPVDGSACTIDTTVTDGALTAATVAVAGSGYQVDDVLDVAGGTGGKVKVATLSGSGVATLTIQAAGSGYTAGTGVATTTTSTRAWVGTAMSALTGASTLTELIQAINDDIAALS